MDRALQERCLALTKKFMKWKIMQLFCDKPDKQFEGDPIGAREYREKVGRPMWLMLVSDNLEKGKYKSLGEYERDMNQIWKNAKTYNRPDSHPYWFAECAEARFKAKVKKIAMSPGENYIRRLTKVARRVAKLTEAFQREIDHTPSKKFDTDRK